MHVITWDGFILTPFLGGNISWTFHSFFDRKSSAILMQTRSSTTSYWLVYRTGQLETKDLNMCPHRANQEIIHVLLLGVSKKIGKHPKMDGENDGKSDKSGWFGDKLWFLERPLTWAMLHHQMGPPGCLLGLHRIGTTLRSYAEMNEDWKANQERINMYVHDPYDFVLFGKLWII